MSALGFLINLYASDSQPIGLECVLRHSVVSNSFTTPGTEAYQAPLSRILEWATISYSGGSSWSGD